MKGPSDPYTHELHLSPDDWRLIADALDAVNPDDEASETRARELAAILKLLDRRHA